MPVDENREMIMKQTISIKQFNSLRVSMARAFTLPLNTVEMNQLYMKWLGIGADIE